MDEKDKTMNETTQGEKMPPFRYRSEEDINFVSKLMKFMDVNYLNGEKDGDSNVIGQWRQKMFCVVNKQLDKGDDTWYSDATKGRAMIETYHIPDESAADWRIRKKELLEFYSQTIAIYHDAVFMAFVQRVGPELKGKMLKFEQELTVNSES